MSFFSLTCMLYSNVEKKNSHGKLVFGGVESMMKLSVMSPNTRQRRGSVVPLTIDITVPTKMSSLSQPSAKRNYGAMGQQRREGGSQQL